MFAATMVAVMLALSIVYGLAYRLSFHRASSKINPKPDYEEITALEDQLDYEKAEDDADWNMRFLRGIAESRNEPQSPEEWQDREGE